MSKSQKKTVSGSDEELIKRVQAGERQAFDVLVNKYQAKIIKVVGGYVKDPHQALDVTQEAFVKAYKGLATFRGDSAFYTWLYRIAINTAKNHLVAEGRRQPDTAIDVQDAEQYACYNELKDASTPEGMLLSEEIKLTVNSAIQHLPEDLKTAITLRELEGMSYEAIAEAMDCPIGTVRSRIFRAREAIDKVLAPLLN